MENQLNTHFLNHQLTFDNEPQNQLNNRIDMKNLQKSLIQSIRYCKGKSNKNKHIKAKKIQQMRKYQQNILRIIKEKSELIISQLTSFSNELINEEQEKYREQIQQEEERVEQLKKKMKQIKSEIQEQQNGQDIIELTENKQIKKGKIELKQSIKRLTQQCEQQLQRMEQRQQQDMKNKKKEQQIINKIQKPFKKLYTYFNQLTSQVNYLNNQKIARKQSTQTKV